MRRSGTWSATRCIHKTLIHKLSNQHSQCTHTCHHYITHMTSANTHYNAYSVVCFQERFQVKNPPHTYIQKLRGYLDPGVTRKVGLYKLPFKCNVYFKENSADFTHQNLFKGLWEYYWICENRCVNPADNVNWDSRVRKQKTIWRCGVKEMQPCFSSLLEACSSRLY